MTPEQIKNLAMQTAVKYGLDPSKFAAQLYHESAGFDPAVLTHKKLSPAGAYGVAQFMPATGASYGLTLGKPDIAKEVDAAGREMKALVGRFGNEALARMAYNVGQGNLNKALEKYKTTGVLNLPKETDDYNANVTKAMTKLFGPRNAKDMQTGGEMIKKTIPYVPPVQAAVVQQAMPDQQPMDMDPGTTDLGIPLVAPTEVRRPSWASQVGNQTAAPVPAYQLPGTWKDQFKRNTLEASVNMDRENALAAMFGTGKDLALELPSAVESSISSILKSINK